MSRQAEVERERRARVITADGEFQTAQQLACASRIMADTSEMMQLRLFQTVVEVAAEKNSTLVMPFPVELLWVLRPGASPVRYGQRCRDTRSGPARRNSARPSHFTPSGVRQGPLPRRQGFANAP
ncbi:hypothetical protein [Streptomyces sp. NPDC056707]|uniref:hypothetical protein n=1 Tax=Streptomyces sp. NPDC056707 TaxID=3345919 RepID=UPI0036BCEC69